MSGTVNMRPLPLAAVLALALCGCAGRFEVRTPAAPKPWEKTAAAELAHYLGLCAEDRVVKVGWRGAVFHVGDTAFARAKGLSPSSFDDEEWCVRSFGRDVVLVGGGTRGTLYAVYHFLEDDCGVRWWMDGDEDVPAAKPLKFGSLDRRGKPFFAYRDIYRTAKSDPRTAVRNRLNGNGDARIPAELGGGFVYGPPYHCHTWDKYLPFAKHGKTHPEWYALVDGKRTGGQRRAQMCLTCPGLVDEFAKRLEGFVAEGEAEAAASGLPNPRIYDISMNDNMRFCTCSNCAVATARYGHSGRQLNFVNAIAGKAAARHPDLLFSTFAYYHSEPAPSNGVRAADNVVVKLCNTRQNMAAGIYEADNRFMHDQVLAWKKFAKNLFVWEYGITFGAGRGYPYPSEFGILEKYRFYADNGVTGLLIEHESPDCADMYELKFYLERKALEDPSQSEDGVIEDFMTRYYGPAGVSILEARRLLDRRRRERGGFVAWFPSTGEFNFFDDRDLAEARRLFDAAEEAVRGDAKLERRVERAWSSFGRLADFRRRFGSRHPPERGVSSRPFFDFPAGTKGFSLQDARHIDYVKDPDLGDPLAGGETVVRVRAEPGTKYGLPFLMGVYNTTDRRGVASKAWQKPKGAGYEWYSLGRVKLPEKGFYLYFTRSWTVQLPISLPGMNGGEFEVKALVKFSGPGFVEGSTGPDEIRIARVAYVDAEDVCEK